jgi:hypothetical protein
MRSLYTVTFGFVRYEIPPIHSERRLRKLKHDHALIGKI